MPNLDTRQLLAVAAVQAGVASEAVEVLTHRQGRLVGRATLPSGSDVVVKVSAEADGFAAEAAAVQTLAAAGLPVSQVRVVRDGPPSVIVLDWTPGRPVCADDAVRVRCQVVDLLTRIHSLPAQAPYGGINADLVTWIDGWRGYALRWWSQQDTTTNDAVRIAQTWYQRVRPLIADRTGSLIMLDGAPDHFVVGPDERVRLIDVAELQPGDPVMDLAVLSLHAPGIFTGLLDQYRQAEVEDRHLAELRPFYVFLRALAAAEWSTGVLHDAAGGAAWLRRAAAELEQWTSSS
nr:phosphotransferase [Micromonospora purpureochromogenes]